MKAIALLEVQAMVAAITGLDAMVKTADVKLIHVEKRLGGRLVTVVVQGEVSAVTAALQAGAAAAKEVGALVAKKALDKKIKTVVFDRGGFIYHGVVKAIAEAAREAGLDF